MRRSGLSLLELILSLTLTAVVLGMVALAIDLHLRALDQRRSMAEESQLARAILRQIANDLNNIVLQQEMDFSSVEGMLSSAAGDLLGGAGGDTSGGDSGGDSGSGGSPGGGSGSGGSGSGGSGSSGGDSMSDADSDSAFNDLTGESLYNTDIAGSTTPPPKPGLYGNQFELQVDVSRLPRVDEYVPEAPAMMGAITDIPSDVKTVAYFVGTTGMAAGTMDPSAVEPQYNSGLIRRGLDRAVTQWASQAGNVLGLQEQAEVLAPEVVGIEFRYFDGLQWQFQWDSSAQGLPMAVEVLLSVQKLPNASTSGGFLPFGANPSTADNMPHVYRLVVRLPMGQLPDTSEEGSSDLEALGL